MPQVTGFDHLVLNVADARRSLAWYVQTLGLQAERLEEWESGEALFVSVRIDEHTIIDLLEAERTGTNVDHVCLVVAPGTDLDVLAEDPDLEVLGPPIEVWGAQGMGRALYVRDPDGNTVELRAYP